MAKRTWFRTKKQILEYSKKYSNPMVIVTKDWNGKTEYEFKADDVFANMSKTTFLSLLKNLTMIDDNISKEGFLTFRKRTYVFN